MLPYYNTMSSAVVVWFGWNQRWGRVIGGDLLMKIKSFFYTHQSAGLWLIALPLAHPLANRLTVPHPNTMGDGLLCWFGCNRLLGQEVGGDMQKQIMSREK